MENYDLVVDNVSKVYKYKKSEREALKGVSFRVKKGEIFGLLGPNGAGKTTLLNIISGILNRDKGNISILNADPFEKREEVMRRVNFISSDTSFHWQIPVIEILRFYARMYQIENIEEKIKELIKLFEIEGLENVKYAYLSSGQKMRVILAKGFINEPEFLFLDEPTTSLDPYILDKVLNIFEKVNKEKGTTILFTSHQMSHVERLCDRVAFIDKGKILDIGKITDLKKKNFTRKVKINVKKIIDKDILEKDGFKIENKVLTKEVDNFKDINKIISKLTLMKMEILDIETIEPNLNDYFIRMVENDELE